MWKAFVDIIGKWDKWALRNGSPWHPS
jgi:hypothetical protein